MAAERTCDAQCLVLMREGNRAFPNLLRYHPPRNGFNQNMCSQVDLPRPAQNLGQLLLQGAAFSCPGNLAISFATHVWAWSPAGSHLPGRPVTSRTKCSSVRRNSALADEFSAFLFLEQTVLTKQPDAFRQVSLAPDPVLRL